MKENITGMMVYYYFVCERKLWYFCHEITMETENEDVLLGKLLDESSYKKNDKHISIDQIINIDFMKESGELHDILRYQKDGKCAPSKAETRPDILWDDTNRLSIIKKDNECGNYR